MIFLPSLALGREEFKTAFRTGGGQIQYLILNQGGNILKTNKTESNHDMHNSIARANVAKENTSDSTVHTIINTASAHVHAKP